MWAENRMQLAGLERHAQRRQQAATVQFVAQIFSAQHQVSTGLRRQCSSSPRKNGAPSSAHRMPTGISAGCTAMRAMVSASVSSAAPPRNDKRSEEHTSELQSLMRISYAVFCLK